MCVKRLPVKVFVCRSSPEDYNARTRDGLIRGGHLEIAILPQFLAIEPRFVCKGCAGHLQIAILPQFLAIEPHFVRKGCVSCCLVGTAPAPAFKREIEKKERARKREEGKRARGEDVR